MFGNLDDPQKQLMLMLGAGLLSPVRNKGFAGFGEALGQGIQGGLLAHNQARQMQDRRGQMDLQRKMQEMQLAEMERAQKFNQVAFRPGIGSPPATPNDDNGYPMPSNEPRFDFAAAAAVDPMRAYQLRQSMNKAEAPIKVSKDEVLLDPITKQPIYTNRAPEKPHWIDGGDKWIPVGMDGKPVGAPIPKNMAPGEAQRIGMEGQRLGMDRARLGMEAGRYNYEVGDGRGIPQKQRDAIAVEVGKDRAKAQVKAEGELPQVEAEAQQTIGLVDKLINHPGFSTVVGSKGPTGIPAAAGYPIPGTDAADFTVLRNQLVGKQFLQAFETLKGGGQITEVEGKKATDAIARMDTAQSEKEFKVAAEEFKAVIRAGLGRAKKKAGSSNSWSIQRVD